MNIPDSFVEDTLQVTLRECRALEVLMCADLLSNREGLLIRDGLHLPRSESLNRVAVVAEIKLGADEDDRDVGGVMFDFGEPLNRA
jgi:hypothetical protein